MTVVAVYRIMLVTELPINRAARNRDPLRPRLISH